MECFLGLAAALFGTFMVFIGIIGMNATTDEGILLISILGLLFMLVGIYVFITTKHKFIAKVNFKKNKIQIEANIIKIYINENCTINGKHPYTLLCSWFNPNTGLEHTFKIGRFVQDPTPYIESTATTTVPIFILPENPEHYQTNMQEFINRIHFK